MIGFIRGKILELQIDTILVDVHGVGYEVSVPVSSVVDRMVGEDIQLWIYTHLREDQLQLFGFSSSLEKNFFLSLLKVNGVGPKLAIKILSGASLERLIDLIETEDVKGLTQIPKVGKKTAEQIILDLKGKLAIVPSEEPKVSRSDRRQELTSALVHLGFRTQDVEKAIARVPETLSLEDSIRQGLQILTGPL